MPAIEASEADADRDTNKAGMTGAMTSTNVVVVALVAGDPEAMEGVQTAEETKDSIIVGTPEGELAEGLMWQAKQHKQEHRQATVECAMPLANMMVEEPLENDLDVQEVFGLVIPDTNTHPRPG